MSRSWLFCLTDGYGGYGGIAQYNRDLIGHLAALRPHDTLHVLQRSGPRAAPAGLPPNLRWHAPRAGRAAYALTLAWLLLRWRPRVFCGHLYMAPLLALLARLLGLRWWLQLHGIEVWQSPPPRCLQAAARADLITVVSRHTRRELLARVPLPSWRVRVLPNTAHPPVPAADVVREPAQLLSITRLSSAERYKGIQRVLAVLPGLYERFPDLRYVVAGDGDDLPWLQSEAARLGVADRVDFTGRVDEARKAALLARAGAFVLPSSGEGFGIVFVEAAAAGCRVVAGNRDGSVDALADGALGTLVDPFDADALAAALTDAVLAATPVPTADAVLARFAPATLRRLLAGLLQDLDAACVARGGGRA